MTGQRLVVLIHRTCGHICSVTGPEGRKRMEALRDDLHAAGHHGWRVQLGEISDATLTSVFGSGCPTCRMTP